MDDKTSAQVAREAIAVLDRDGWGKGATTISVPSYSSVGMPGAHCLGGAINIAVKGSAIWIPYTTDPEYAACCRHYEVVAAKIRERYPDFPHDPFQDTDVFLLTSWNDADGTTEHDVRGVLEEIAAGV